MSTAERGDGAAPDLKTTAGKLADLRNRLADAQHPVGPGVADTLHEQGRLTARERVQELLDEGSFTEVDALAKHRSNEFSMPGNKPYGDGVVVGYGTVDGREVCVYSQDASVYDGALGEVHGEKILKTMDLAVKTGRPLIGIVDGSGVRVEEGVVALGLAGDIFQRAVRASGVIPQISLVVGPTTGAAAYATALSDFTVMVSGPAQLYVMAPEVITTVTGDDVTAEELGGAHAQVTRSGVAHHIADDEKSAIGYIKELLGFLPSNNRAEAPREPAAPREGSIEDAVTDTDRELDGLVPDSTHEPYDVHGVIDRLLDDEFFEVQADRAANIVIGFGRIDGRSVGIVANQPTVVAGCLDIDAAEKAARFVRTCDAFNIPIVTLVDVPGFLPDTAQEHGGLLRRGAKLLYAYGEATVGKVTVVIGKAFGPAYDIMGSKHLGADVNLAWPTAQIAVTDPAAAANVVYRGKLAKAAEEGEDVDALTLQLRQQYEDALVTPYVAAERGYIDAVIPPSHTRGQVANALGLLERKFVQTPPRKHGNIPL
ncbi:MAG: acyl-CoA carboxylase subunit beta [Gordonia sp. (in: high G+C Gram-positive bacteria)]|uniref:acyl-CoA carboxylase subunit beta n=1 Tax=Gordonia sp. (in: high G+C Gram-positive bacteria) TaxID=84139 RepID=UPI0039E65F7B